MSSHIFSNISGTPPDALFSLKGRFIVDTNTQKVDLGIGAYRDENGKPWVLPSIRKADEILHSDPDFNHEYLAITGFAPFVTNAAKVILGDDSPALREGRVVSVQSLSGTGSLHIAGKFIKQFYNKSQTVYLSKPTWGNHFQVFHAVGLKTDTYSYWDAGRKALDIENYLQDLENAPDGSIIVLHACAHNPTGMDPSKEEWARIFEVLKRKDHLPLFDSAYQGFASGDLDKDAYFMREAIKTLSTPILICQSFAKNFGMYGERVGAFHLVLPSSDNTANIKSQLATIIRSEVSNTTAYGAKLVATVLCSPELTAQWHQDLITMSSRIGKQRRALRDHLVKLGTPGNWDHIVKQQGMFSFTGLTAEQVHKLETKHSIYLASNGRISVAGLNNHNIEYVARAFDDVVHNETKL